MIAFLLVHASTLTAGGSRSEQHAMTAGAPKGLRQTDHVLPVFRAGCHEGGKSRFACVCMRLCVRVCACVCVCVRECVAQCACILRPCERGVRPCILGCLILGVCCVETSMLIVLLFFFLLLLHVQKRTALDTQRIDLSTYSRCTVHAFDKTPWQKIEKTIRN